VTAAHEVLVRTRHEQGLPEHVEDEGALAQIALLLNVADGAPRKGAAAEIASGVADAMPSG